MAYSALKLINKAYYLSGIVGRNLETVSGQQQIDGLDLLNALLEVKSDQPELIPYFKRDTLTLLQGVEEYFIPNLIAIETLTFNLQDVRYSMLEQSRVKYFGSGRVDNIQSLPYNWRLEREKGGARLFVYFLPNETYIANYSGKFALTDVSLNTDLETAYDGFYIEYLRYALAKFICDENDIEMTPGKQKRLQVYEKTLISVSPADLTMQKMSTLQQHRGLNWGDVNLGRGWSPGM